uniref:Uncharacterized protein n=1 Tax=Timema cristinae TaxID=61476 RepID=A0A7R9GZ21_TIMCR|nr:unnamed protein product [Timema cristinae]
MLMTDIQQLCEVCELAALDEATKCLGDKHISDTASPQYPVTQLNPNCGCYIDVSNSSCCYPRLGSISSLVTSVKRRGSVSAGQELLPDSLQTCGDLQKPIPVLFLCSAGPLPLLRLTCVQCAVGLRKKMRYLKSYLTLVLRVVLPIFVTAYYVWLRNQRSVVNGVRRQLFPAILAAITSSVTLTTLSGQWRPWS